jgi:hypothetical protein
MPAPHFQDRLQLGVFGIAQSQTFTEFALGCLQQRAQSPVLLQEFPRQIHGRFTHATHAQEDSKQFCIG